MIGGSREVIEESKALDRLAMEIVDGIQEMASGAEQIDTAVHQVNDISIENKQQKSNLSWRFPASRLSELRGRCEFPNIRVKTWALTNL
ncbi:MAG: hypothetical protein LBF87_05350 [Treponema sp.]|jgi:methyl-accepting chemotaxis protein|nr:hypothetical protein [Treponema sp.]